MRTAWLVIVGAVLPLLLGAVLGSRTTDAGEGTWARPMPPTAFLVLSLGLAVSHLLVLLGYAEVARRSADLPLAVRLAGLGAAGSALLAVCEVWSGLVARTDLDAGVLDVLEAAYGVSSVAVLVGTLGAGLVLRGAGSRLAAPLLLNALRLAAAIPVRLLGSDGLGIALLTVWSLTYVWLAVRLGVRGRQTSTVSPGASHV